MSKEKEDEKPPRSDDPMRMIKGESTKPLDTEIKSAQKSQKERKSKE